jgi:hypothetical protein
MHCSLFEPHGEKKQRIENMRRAVCTDLGGLADYGTSMQRRSNSSFW